MSTVIIVPVLRRPHRVAPLLASIEAATLEPHRVLFMCSPNDRDEHAAVNDAGAASVTVDWRPGNGDYARKINAAYRASTEQFLFLAADDLHFHSGWLTAAMRRMADPRVGVVGTQDLGNRRVIEGEHATHSLIRRSYADWSGTIDKPGEILHEGYRHNFCDDELVATAKKRGAWAFADDSVVEHLHPDWQKAPRDGVYRIGRSGFRVDRARFAKREPLWT